MSISVHFKGAQYTIPGAYSMVHPMFVVVNVYYADVPSKTNWCNMFDLLEKLDLA